MHHRHQILKSTLESSDITVNDCKSKYAVVCATNSASECDTLRLPGCLASTKLDFALA